MCFISLNLYSNFDFGPNTKKYQNHIFCSYGYKFICVDDRYRQP